MTREAYLNYCAGLPGAVVDQPFPEDFQSWVARHWDSRKWFALVMKVDGRDAVNLKCSPMEADLLRSAYTGVRPGYHMNKTHWISVILDGSLSDAEILPLIDDSYALTLPRAPKKKVRRDDEC